DFATMVAALDREDYRVGALVIDAVRFLPHSRPRLFVLGVQRGVPVHSQLTSPDPLEPWHTKSLRLAFARLPERLQNDWIWWNLPIPNGPIPTCASVMKEERTGEEWHTKEQT